MSNGIIRSILDTDLYKLTMQQAVFYLFRKRTAKYKLIFRGKNCFGPMFAPMFKEQLEQMKNLRLTEEEEKYLLGLRFMREKYVKWLKDYRFKPGQLTWSVNDKNELSLEINGPWVETILWEVPLMALISEIRTILEVGHPDMKEIEEKTLAKAKFAVGNKIFFSDFGTRRRMSFEVQKRVVKIFKENFTTFNGTSNVLLAMELGVTPIGTMAHEWISAHLVLVDDIRTAQRAAFLNWMHVYGLDLGVALTDTFGTNAFFKDFFEPLPQDFKGVRQDSGDPVVFVEKMIKHYTEHKVDPTKKTVICSDGLNFDKAKAILDHFKGEINIAFGIGTFLTHDYSDLPPLNMVIKLIEIDGKPVVKIGDSYGGKSIKLAGDQKLAEKVLKSYEN